MADSSNLCDIAIIGGGIAGLWLLSRFRSAGYTAVLIEKDALGAGQTLASQGMIHGGIKYTLNGMLTDASETIAAMPRRWRACLAGKGEVDLAAVKILSDDYYLFSDGRLSSRLTAFFGSKAVKGRVDPVPRADLPELLQHPEFRGLVYRLQDVVIDTPSLVNQLARQSAGAIYTGDYELEQSGDGFTVTLGNGSVLNANHLVLAAGEGNDELTDKLKVPATMQRRPLNQVVVRGDLPPLYAHAVSMKSGDKPRLTITTHEGDWYLGGQIAETGVDRDDDAQCEYARQELRVFFPWISFDNCRFSTLRINRAEAGTAERLRPDAPYARTFGNVTVCWPTKLTLVPLLGDEVMAQIRLGRTSANVTLPEALVSIAPYPWNRES